MFLCAEHVRWWKIILKYTVNRALYHILLEIIKLKCIYLNSVLLFTCMTPQEPTAAHFIKYNFKSYFKKAKHMSIFT